VITGHPRLDDLWGYSPSDGLVHWYTVRNAGRYTITAAISAPAAACSRSRSCRRGRSSARPLEARFPARPLLGRNPRGDRLIWRLISESIAYVAPALDRLCLPIHRGKRASIEEVRAGVREVLVEHEPPAAILQREPSAPAS
jgi:hypothetical protein